MAIFLSSICNLHFALYAAFISLDIVTIVYVPGNLQRTTLLLQTLENDTLSNLVCTVSLRTKYRSFYFEKRCEPSCI